MPRTITLHPLSLAVGATVIIGAFLLASQTPPPAQVVWPPPKSLMLNLFEQPSPPISLPGGGVHTLLTVPTDRWLTITGATLQVGAGNVNWAEVTSSGALVRKGSASAPLAWPQYSPSNCGGPIGWTFAPGSSVALVNMDTGTVSLNGYALIGYYSRN